MMTPNPMRFVVVVAGLLLVIGTTFAFEPRADLPNTAYERNLNSVIPLSNFSAW